MARFNAHLRGRLYWPIAALFSALWCATGARLLAELWPRQLIGLASPTALIISGAIGAVLSYIVFKPWRIASAPHAFWPLGLSALYLFQPTAAPIWGIAALLSGLGGVLWLSARWPAGKSEWLWDITAFVAPLALFVATCAPSVLPGDSAEFQFVVPTWGIPHPTGYPLYLLLGRLAMMLPLGSIAYRLNLFSAVAAAGAVWALYRAARALDLSRAAALIGAAMLTVSATFWSQATIAEKYALNAFFVALTLWLGLEWHKRRSARWLAVWIWSYGLSLTHHRTMLMLAPAYLLLIWLTDRALLHPKMLLRLSPLFFTPLSLYLVLPLFSSLNPPYAYMRIDSLRSFFDLVLARTYQSGLFRGGWAALPNRVGELGQLLWQQFGLPGLAMILLGWIALWRQKRAIAWTLLAGIAGEVFFALNYYVPNTAVYYLPAYVWLALCATATVQAGIVGLRTSRSLYVCWVLLLAVWPLSLGISRFAGHDQRRAYAGLAFDYIYGQMALRAVEENALIVGDWLPATVLWYMQLTERLAPTAQIVAVDSLEWQWHPYVEQGLRANRPVYLARPLMAAGDRYVLASAGPLIQVRETSVESQDDHCVALPAPQTTVRWCGFDLAATPPGAEGQARPVSDGQAVEGGSTLHLTLYWQAQTKPSRDYAVTVRLIDPAGQVQIEKQSRHPVGGTYPTSRWQTSGVVPDYYRLSLPAALPSGRYTVQVELGLPFQPGDRLNVVNLEVIKPPRWPYATPSTPLRRSLGSVVLLGHDAPPQAAVGEVIKLALLWLVRHTPEEWPTLVLVDQDGTERTVSTTYDNWADWRPGAQIVQPYTIEITETLARVEVKMGVQRVRLPLRVVQSPPPLANFGNRIRLRSYQYDQRTLKAGDTLRLTLNWEAIGPLDEPYKVFVHVLGSNGLPVAQQDNEPLNGTYPTTRWTRGERVADPYAFNLPVDLSPGEYQVEVGLYRLADLGRLPVLDTNQNAIDDKVFLDPIVVVGP